MENVHIHSDDPIDHHHPVDFEEPAHGGLSNGFFVASFLILLTILIVFGDMFIFILGLLGMVAAYAGYFTEQAEQEAARH